MLNTVVEIYLGTLVTGPALVQALWWRKHLWAVGLIALCQFVLARATRRLDHSRRLSASYTLGSYRAPAERADSVVSCEYRTLFRTLDVLATMLITRDRVRRARTGI